MAAIQVEDLTRTFGDLAAVDGVSFSVEDGEIFGLLGPNGAGKSTLINMLVTLLRPTSGTATVKGHDVRQDTAAVRNSLGIVFQEPALDEELTGEENLAFHGRLYGQRKAAREERIDKVLDIVGLSEERHDAVGTYSGGMKRRLEIGRGLLHEPAVLFLDEPTAGLDARTRRDTWEYIQRMNREVGVSIVLTTHYIEEAEQLCDRVAIVDDGQIAAIDTPDALKAELGGDVVLLDATGPLEELCDRFDDASWVADYRRSDTGVHVTVDSGNDRIADVVRLADESGVAIESIDLRKPNLETVFLSQTGATIREREATDDGEEGTRGGRGRTSIAHRADDSTASPTDGDR